MELFLTTRTEPFKGQTPICSQSGENTFFEKLKLTKKRVCGSDHAISDVKLSGEREKVSAKDPKVKSPYPNPSILVQNTFYLVYISENFIMYLFGLSEDVRLRPLSVIFESFVMGLHTRNTIS